MGNSHHTDAAADVRSNQNSSTRPSAKDATRRIDEAIALNKAEWKATKKDFKVLTDASLELAKELARPTPGMFNAVVQLTWAMTGLLRECRMMVGTLTAAVPGMAAAMRKAKDTVNAYTVEELDNM